MGDLLNRFEGTANRARLLEAVKLQQLVGGNADLAETLIDQGTLEEIPEGQVMIEQDEYDDDLFLILAGSFQVTINGHDQAVRTAGIHVGEQSAIDPSQPRSATLTAKQLSLVLRLSQQALAAASAIDQDLWKRLARTLQNRLEERNQEIGRTNEFPRIFIISSGEALEVANEIHRQLDSDEIAVQVWDQGTFGISDYPISSLMDAIHAADFTISIAKADDTLVSRGATHNVARDNVHLEYGISLGILGRSRSILLVCTDTKTKLPSDLAGLTTLRYRHRNDDDLKRSIRTVCTEIKEHIHLEGVFQDRRA